MRGTGLLVAPSLEISLKTPSPTGLLIHPLTLDQRTSQINQSRPRSTIHGTNLNFSHSPWTVRIRACTMDEWMRSSDVIGKSFRSSPRIHCLNQHACVGQGSSNESTLTRAVSQIPQPPQHRVLEKFSLVRVHAQDPIIISTSSRKRRSYKSLSGKTLPIEVSWPKSDRLPVRINH